MKTMQPCYRQILTHFYWTNLYLPMFQLSICNLNQYFFEPDEKNDTLQSQTSLVKVCQTLSIGHAQSLNNSPIYVHYHFKLVSNQFQICLGQLC